MRKIVSCIMIVMMLTFAGTKTADALVLDPAALSAKISEWVGKVTDAVTKVTQQISQVKQMAAQGFSKAELFTQGRNYLEKYLSNNPFGGLNNKAIEEDTKAKEKKQLEDDKDFYQETSEKYYEVKQKVVDENINKQKTDLQTTKTELKTAENTERVKKEQYEAIKKQTDDIEKVSKAHQEYEDASALVNELRLKKEELEHNVSELEKTRGLLKEEASKVGTSADKEYKAYEDKIKSLESSKDVEVEIKADNVDDMEWDAQGLMEKFTTNEEDYREFIKKYFYSDFNINSSGNVDRLAHQTEMDRVMRSRKKLLVDSATHLLQVTATIRRELPERANLVKEMFDGVRSTDSEFQAIGYYSGTKVENIRALLLYAKLQSAKLQYIAAKELLVVEPRRRGDANDEEYEFNLGKYLLTDSYVKAIEDEANKEIDAFKE